MNINIDALSEPDLIDLNHRIVARLRLLAQLRAHSAMLEFRVGDRVSFQPDSRGPRIGILSQYNRKTVTVITEQGERWNVAPALLRKVERTEAPDSDKPTLEMD